MMLQLSPISSKPENWAITWHLIAQFSVFTQQNAVTVRHKLSALPLKHLLERRAVEGVGVVGSGVLWESKSAGGQASGWIPTLFSGCLQSLLCDISRQWILASCRLDLGHRSAEKRALLKCCSTPSHVFSSFYPYSWVFFKTHAYPHSKSNVVHLQSAVWVTYTESHTS